MAANIPATTNTINTIVSPCAGFSYQPPLPGQHHKYEFEINSVPGPYLNFSVVLPEESVIIPIRTVLDKLIDLETAFYKLLQGLFKKYGLPIKSTKSSFFDSFYDLLNSIPKFHLNCDEDKPRMIFGIPCSIKICSTKKCKRIFGRKFCIPLYYPCGKYVTQIYLVEYKIPDIHLFTIPKLGIEMDFNSSTNTRQKVELLSNTPVGYWVDLLIYCGLNADDIFPNYDKIDPSNSDAVERNNVEVKKVIDKILGAAARTLSYLLRQLILFSVGKSFEMEVSIRITKLIIDINLDLDEFRIFAGSKEFKVKNLTYTLKDINILKLMNADRIEFKFTNANFIIDYVVGTFTLDFTPIDMITSMLKNKINQLKTISGGLSLELKNELETAEEALSYIQNLADLGDYIPFIKGPGLNFFKEFIVNLQPKLFVYLRICPLQGQVAVCTKLQFDPTEYFKKIANFLIDNMSAGFDQFDALDEIPQNILRYAPYLGYLNYPVKIINNAIVYVGKEGLKLASDGFNTKTQDFLMNVNFCTPL